MGLYRFDAEVTTCDLSTLGFGFIHTRYLPPGTIIYLPLSVQEETAIVTGVVRNYMLVEGIRHRVGVEFTGVAR